MAFLTKVGQFSVGVDTGAQDYGFTVQELLVLAASSTEIQTAIANAIAGKADINDVSNAIATAVSGKANKTALQALAQTIAELNVKTIKGTWTPQVIYDEGYPLVYQINLGEVPAELLVEGSKVTLLTAGEAPSGMATNDDVAYAEKSVLYFKMSAAAEVEGFASYYIALVNGAQFDESLTAALAAGLAWSTENGGELTLGGVGNILNEDMSEAGINLPMTQAEFVAKTWALCFDSSVGNYGEVSLYDTDAPTTPLTSYQLQQDIGNPLCAVLVTPYAWDDTGMASSSVEIIHEPANPIVGFTTLKIGAEATLSFDGVTANNAYVVAGETGASFGLHDGDIAFIGADGASIQQVLKSSADVDLSAYYTKTQTNNLLAEKVSMGDLGSAATQDVEAFATATQGLLAEGALPLATWKAFPLLTPSDDVLQLPKGVYTFNSNVMPVNVPNELAVGGRFVLVVSQDPYIDSYDSQQLGSLRILGRGEIWEWLRYESGSMTGWVKTFPADIPVVQSDLGELDSDEPAYVKNVMAIRSRVGQKTLRILSSSSSNITVPLQGATVVDDSDSGTPRTMTWEIGLLYEAAKYNLQSTIITSSKSVITLVVKSNGSTLYSAVLDKNCAYLAMVTTPIDSGSFSLVVEKIIDAQSIADQQVAQALLGKTPYTPIRLTSSDDLDEVESAGWYVFATNSPPANCFDTTLHYMNPEDVLLEVYNGIGGSSGTGNYRTIVQEVREGAGYFAQRRETMDSIKTWGSWTAF